MTAGIEYGKALFLLAEEEGALAKVNDDLNAAKSVLEENPEYVKMIDSPAIPKEERISLLRTAFAGLDERVRNLFLILCERRSIYVYSDVCDTFSALYDEKMGIVKCEAVTAIPLSPERESALCKKLSEITGKTIIIKNTVDPSILGGVKLRYLGIQIDGSVKTRLDGFAESLKNIII